MIRLGKAGRKVTRYPPQNEPDEPLCPDSPYALWPELLNFVEKLWVILSCAKLQSASYACNFLSCYGELFFVCLVLVNYENLFIGSCFQIVFLEDLTFIALLWAWKSFQSCCHEKYFSNAPGPWLLQTMCTLERVQPFCASFKYWDFLFFS